MINLKALFSGLLLLFWVSATTANGTANFFPSYKSSDPVDDVLENIKDAIIGRGLNISATLHASDMLNRTGADLGFPDNVYMEAQTVEFCSATLSHQLVAANPSNIVLCPFTISVYLLTSDPAITHVSYRIPVAGEETSSILEKVEKLIRDIINEALE